MPKAIQPPADLSAVVPCRLYDTRAVAALLGKTQKTVRGWIASGHLPASRGPKPRSPHRVYGSAILALAPAGGVPIATPSAAEIRRQAEEAVAAIRAMARK